MTEKGTAPHSRGVPDERDSSPRDDDVIRIEDLAPAEDVKGGRKIVLGEIAATDDTPYRNES